MTSQQLVNDWKQIKTPIGLFGGTFDPVQKAHLAVADTSLKTGKVGSVVFIPARQNPLKAGDPGATGDFRLEMLKVAIQDRENLYLSDIELARDPHQPSYTFDTVSYIRAALKDGQPLAFIMGSDCLEWLHKWHRIHELIALLDAFIVYPRGHDLTHAKDGLKQHFSEDEVAKLLFNQLNAPELAFSSTDVRDRVKNNKRIDDLVPDGIQDFVVKQQLYKA